MQVHDLEAFPYDALQFLEALSKLCFRDQGIYFDCLIWLPPHHPMDGGLGRKTNGQQEGFLAGLGCLGLGQEGPPFFGDTRRTSF